MTDRPISTAVAQEWATGMRNMLENTRDTEKLLNTRIDNILNTKMLFGRGVNPRGFCDEVRKARTHLRYIRGFLSSAEECFDAIKENIAQDTEQKTYDDWVKSLYSAGAANTATRPEIPLREDQRDSDDPLNRLTDEIKGLMAGIAVGDSLHIVVRKDGDTEDTEASWSLKRHQ